MVVEVMRVGIVDGYGVRFLEDRWFNPAPLLFTRKVFFQKVKTLLIYLFLSSRDKKVASNFGRSNISATFAASTWMSHFATRLVEREI
jgi:hypothetical protein